MLTVVVDNGDADILSEGQVLAVSSVCKKRMLLRCLRVPWPILIVGAIAAPAWASWCFRLVCVACAGFVSLAFCGSLCSSGACERSFSRIAISGHVLASWITSWCWHTPASSWALFILVDTLFIYASCSVLLGSGVLWHAFATLVGSAICFLRKRASNTIHWHHRLLSESGRDGGWEVEVVILLLSVIVGACILAYSRRHTIQACLLESRIRRGPAVVNFDDVKPVGHTPAAIVEAVVTVAVVARSNRQGEIEEQLDACRSHADSHTSIV